MGTIGNVHKAFFIDKKENDHRKKLSLGAFINHVVDPVKLMINFKPGPGTRSQLWLSSGPSVA